ncbi:hypothetical protein [Christiangramia sabulilitoris]|uniref:hypothetical protein n=1 Tax=Christiangramia sabulilitoris TaxID=2583991 RepID=UPI001408F122|nr:hypothetical protein [Christiangramia sabulilitoris]
MATKNQPKKFSDMEFLQTSARENNKVIYIAIVLVLVFTLVAMTGVYYEYW